MHRNKNKGSQLTAESSTTGDKVRYVDREKEIKSKIEFRDFKIIHEKEIFNDVRQQRKNKNRNHPRVIEYNSASSSVEEQKNHWSRVREHPIFTQKQNISKICTFYRSDGRNLRGLTLSIIGYKNINHLLEAINTKLSPGMRYIYPIPRGPLIKSLDHLEHNRSYVVCQDKIPVHKKSLRKDKPKDKPRSNPPEQFQCRIITICSSKNKNRKEMIILNPGTEMTFEELIDDMGNRLQFSGTTLHKLRDPGEKVQNYQELFSPKFSNTDDFLLCGPELVPKANKSKAAVPFKHSYQNPKLISIRPIRVQRSQNLDAGRTGTMKHMKGKAQPGKMR